MNFTYTLITLLIIIKETQTHADFVHAGMNIIYRYMKCMKYITYIVLMLHAERVSPTFDMVQFSENSHIYLYLCAYLFHSTKYQSKSTQSKSSLSNVNQIQVFQMQVYQMSIKVKSIKVYQIQVYKSQVNLHPIMKNHHVIFKNLII